MSSVDEYEQRGFFTNPVIKKGVPEESSLKPMSNSDYAEFWKEQSLTAPTERRLCYLFKNKKK